MSTMGILGAQSGRFARIISAMAEVDPARWMNGWYQHWFATSNFWWDDDYRQPTCNCVGGTDLIPLPNTANSEPNQTLLWWLRGQFSAGAQRQLQIPLDLISYNTLQHGLAGSLSQDVRPVFLKVDTGILQLSAPVNISLFPAVIFMITHVKM